MLPAGKAPGMDDDWFPRLPTLRPGLRIVRRDDGALQIGFHPRERVTLPDLPEAHAFLAALAQARRPDLGSARVRRWARALADRGLVVDRDQVGGLMGLGVPRPAVAAALAHAGPAAADRLAGRTAARIAFDAPEPWRTELVALLDEAGLRVAGRSESVTAQLVVTPGGELPRPWLDGWMRAGLPHLVVTNVAGRIRLGPFVAAGLTACLRCLDAHASDQDPGHGLVVEQHQPVADEPCDPLLMRIALACAVRDLTSYVEGDAPATWSATIAVEPSLRLERQQWTRHHRCGCAWGEQLAAG